MGNNAVKRAAAARYTPEEVWEADAGIMTLGENELRALVSEALSRVPRRVADRVFAGCIFIMAKFEWGAGTYIPKELLQGKCVIALSEKLMDEDRESAIRTILHEVAHFYLEHVPPGLATDLGESCDCRQEEEAERQAGRWLRAAAGARPERGRARRRSSAGRMEPESRPEAEVSRRR